MNRPTTLPARIRQVFLLLAVLFSGSLALRAERDPLSGREIPGVLIPEPESARQPKEPVPSAPAGMILDPVQVLQPDAVARLSAKLVAAQALGVKVYVITVPSLKVPPSKRMDRLAELARDYADAWTSGAVGAVILFDDEGGLMTVLLSQEADHRFAAFALEMEMKEPVGKAQQLGLAREKLEHSAEIVVETLSGHQVAAVKTARRNRIWNIGIGVIAVLGIGLAVLSVLSRPNTPVASE